MASIIRTVATSGRVASQIASSSSTRSIATSAVRQAGGGAKGKGSKGGAVVKKKAPSSYGSKNKKAGEGGSGGGGGSGSSSKTSIEIRYAEAKPAPDLSDLPKLHADAYAPLYAGKAVTFPRPAFESLKKFGLPRRLGRELDSAGGPACVVRKQTLEMATLLDKAKTNGSSRHVLCGERGSGKSVLLLQAANYALQSGWIVLYVPNAISWIDSSSAYRYDAESQTFHQPALAAKTIETMRAVNGNKLDALQVKLGEGSASSSIKLPDGREIKSGMKLSELAAMGEDHAVSVAVLRLLLDSLASQTQNPILLAVDEAQVLFDTSLYRTPDYVRVESYQLSMPLLALDFISGRKAFQSGGVLMTYSHTSPNWALNDTFCSALSLPTSHPITAYTAIQPVHHAHLQGVAKFEVPRSTPDEALGLFDIWRRKGWTHTGDETFMTALSASDGNMGLFGRSLGRTLQMARA